MFPLFTTLLFLTTSAPASAPASAQTVGGEWKTLHQFDGATSSMGLGNAVADAGDVDLDGITDLFIGAQLANTLGMNGNGKASIHSGADGSRLFRWTGDSDYDRFGGSISSAGDINGDGFPDFVVGATGVDFPGQSSVGSAYAYSGADGSLLYRWDGVAEWDIFGASVSGPGDINQDGFQDILVGAPGTDHGGVSDTGSVYLYSGSDGTIIYEWHGAGYGYQLGTSVSGAGDIDQDGVPDLAIGSVASAVYLYSGATGALIRQLTGPAYAGFGEAVAGAGDVNNDGYDDVIVGARYGDAGGLYNSGSAYVHSGLDGSVLHQWNGDYTIEEFGWSVAGIGDVNEDGFDDVIVGAPFSSPGAFLGGAAHVFSGADGSLIIEIIGQSDEDNLGMAVSGVRGVAHADSPGIIIGAPGDSSAAFESGAAFVLNFFPFLKSNSTTVSASTGGVINFDLDFRSTAASMDYKILISQSGVGPTFYGVNIPLTQDSLVLDTFFGNYPIPTHSGLQGTLDANGMAAASLTVPGGLPSALIGNTYYLAAIANPTSQLPAYSSVAVPLTIMP